MDKSLLTAYLEQVQRYPLLSAEQEKILSYKIQKGDNHAKMQLVNSNLRLVVSISKKYANNTSNFMDIIQEGNLGLLTAASKFNYSYKTRFATYAYPWISQCIIRYLQNKNSAISIPYRKDESLRRLRRSKTYLAQSLGRQPSVKELAVYMDTSEKVIEDIQKYEFSYTSINSEIKGTNGITYGDSICDNRQLSVENTIIKDFEINKIKNLVDNLPDRERQVIYFRYNLLQGNKPKTLRQIAELLGISAESVRQTELRALKTLRKAAAGVV
ncbi:MAG: RNA polymerase sigma factor RpoD/SigA [Spirochaetaceae bacterium]|nr:RNA polymerase sigma factor RpoD/SigA [Spirochaetaceae bacterium]